MNLVCQYDLEVEASAGKDGVSDFYMSAAEMNEANKNSFYFVTDNDGSGKTKLTKFTS